MKRRGRKAKKNNFMKERDVCRGVVDYENATSVCESVCVHWESLVNALPPNAAKSKKV